MMNDITEEESWILQVCRFNRTHPLTEIKKSIEIGRLKITFNWRSKKNLFGRFGGGWNWKLGFQLGGSTLIVDLFICSVRIYYRKGETR